MNSRIFSLQLVQKLNGGHLEDGSTLLRPDEQAASAVCPDQLVIRVARIGRCHRWQIYDLYESGGKWCPMDRLLTYA